jgi:hypothetical protein
MLNPPIPPAGCGDHHHAFGADCTSHLAVVLCRLEEIERSNEQYSKSNLEPAELLGGFFHI